MSFEMRFRQKRSGQRWRSEFRSGACGGLHSQEQGYVLLLLVFMIALILLALALAAPKIASAIRRDREIEMKHRGMQYARAVRLYYRKFGNYPATLDQLVNTNNVRYLRKKYKDPMTGKADWRLVHFGQAGGAAAVNGATLASDMGANGSASATSGSGNGATDNSGNNAPSGNQNGSQIGSPNGNLPGNNNNSNSIFSQNSSGSQTGSNATGGGLSGGTASSFQNTGGRPIIGVASTSKQEGILVIKKKTHYNEWEFIYDPTQDLGNTAANGLGAATTGAPTTNSGFQSSPGMGTNSPTPTPTQNPPANPGTPTPSQ